MELYDKMYVYFDWDDVLEGKECFVADYIDNLKWNVNNNSDPEQITHNKDNDSYPFREKDTKREWCFAYYDPYYELRKAYLEGKQLQLKDGDDWIDIDGEPCFIGDEYRIKPEVYYVECDDVLGFVIITKRGEGPYYWTGTRDDCLTWIEKHKHLEDIAKAYEKGKMIQFFDGKEWKDCWNPKVPKGSPLWEADVSYRIQPEKRVPFDTVQELITHWEGMNPGCTNRPKCAMPMIWVKSKSTECIYLIDGYDYNDNEVSMCNCWFPLDSMFKDYTFINDSIIGKRDK